MEENYHKPINIGGSYLYQGDFETNENVRNRLNV